MDQQQKHNVYEAATVWVLKWTLEIAFSKEATCFDKEQISEVAVLDLNEDDHKQPIQRGVNQAPLVKKDSLLRGKGKLAWLMVKILI